MTIHIIIGILIGFGLYLLFSKRSQRAGLQSASTQHINNHHSHDESSHNNSDHNHKNGHGCCG